MKKMIWILGIAVLLTALYFLFVYVNATRVQKEPEKRALTICKDLGKPYRVHVYTALKGPLGGTGGYIADFEGADRNELIPGAPIYYYDSEGKLIDSINPLTEKDKVPAFEAWSIRIEKDYPLKTTTVCS